MPLKAIESSGGSRDYVQFFDVILKWGKTTTHILQGWQSIVRSWERQPNILEEKTFARQKATLLIKLTLKIKFWRTWKSFALTPGAQGKHLAHLRQLSQLSQKCLPCLPSKWVSLGVLFPIMLWWFCWCSGWPMVKNLWLYNLMLEQAMRNLACGDQ